MMPPAPAKPSPRDVPLVRPAFRREFLDFERGIRMGRLEPNERITQIVRRELVRRHDQLFLIDKWGRGVYWRWISWLPRANRDSKPLSSGYSFSSAKFFVSLFPGDDAFKAGLQVERAAVRPGPDAKRDVVLREDWDWHRFAKGLRKGSPLAAELERLVAREGFTARVGGFSEMTELRGRRWGGVRAAREAVKSMPDDAWGGVQVYYPTTADELAAMTGSEIIATVLAVFDEVTPLANLVMTEPCLVEPGRR